MSDTAIERNWDYLIENNIATEETLKIITSINGYNLDTLNDVLYTVTGERDIDYLIDQEEYAL